MYWTRVKTILIIVFFCINVFLLSSMIITVNQSLVISPETLKNTVAILARNNINVNVEIIPTKISNLRSLELVNVLQDTDSIAKNLLSEGFEKRNSGNVIEYVKETKVLKFEGCKFTYSDSNPSTEINNFGVESAEKSAENILKKLGINLKYIVLSEQSKKGEEQLVLRFNQVYSKKDIFESQIIAVVSPKGVVSLQGYGLVPIGFAPEKYPSRHVTSILIDLIRNQNIAKKGVVTITGLSYGYYIPSDKDVMDVKVVRAVPKWRIQTDNCGELYYDAIIDKEENSNSN